MIYAQLGFLTLIPSIVSCLLFAFYKTKLKKSIKEIICGLAFGLAAVVSTLLSVPLFGTLISARDASVLIAGLVFGPKASLLAGLIGGIHRFFVQETYISLGPSLTTILSGVIAAMLRRWMFDDKRPSWIYGTAIIFVIEVVNMLFVFLFNMQNVKDSFLLVEKVVFPMILTNSFSVAISMLIISFLSGDIRIRKKSNKDRLKLAETFSRWLFVCVLLAFVLSSLFIYVLETRLAYSDAEEMLKLYIEDVRDDINDTSDENLLKLTRAIKEDLEKIESWDRATLLSLLDKYDVSEINIIDENGIIVESTTLIFYDFDMSSGEQSKEFLVLLNGTNELVQRYQKVSHRAGIQMKYAAVTLSKGGFVQVGYNSKRFQKDINERVRGLTRNRHIGEAGFMLISSNSFNLVSDSKGHEGETIDVTGIKIDGIEEWAISQQVVYGVGSLVMYSVTEGYYIIGVIPMTEVVFDRNMSLYTTVFIMIMVFAVLFLLIYFLVKKLVVENIQKINSSLEEITGGNLNVSVDVRTNKEFVSLSDDINSTVKTLKGLSLIHI